MPESTQKPEHDGGNGAAPKPDSPEAIIARAAKLREEGTADAGPQIRRQPTTIMPTFKMRSWFRTHPDGLGVYKGIHIFTDITDDQEFDQKPYYVPKGHGVEYDLAMTGGLMLASAYLVQTATGTTQLFLVREAGDDGKLHAATEQKHEACELAQMQWVRMVWSMEDKQYLISCAEWDRKEPVWPEDLSETPILLRAFRKSLITSLDHPMAKRIMGTA